MGKIKKKAVPDLRQIHDLANVVIDSDCDNSQKTIILLSVGEQISASVGGTESRIAKLLYDTAKRSPAFGNIIVAVAEILQEEEVIPFKQ
ncbi:MAG: hypothetical protein LBE04_05725 [Prevotellaceae bacterium]|jgi:hypothetical protein|nr:hypothetical protein [Prevotellaceae bacterium]